MAPSVSKHFTTKKANILSALSVPDEQYTDLSPKGSVDAGIRDLIDEINQLDGVVTTSSCAGRISVFLEGSKAKGTTAADDDEETTARQAAVPGGKGLGGRWLFISHDPVEEDGSWAGSDGVHAMFGLSQSRMARCPDDLEHAHLVRLQFEPMILHIMTASLLHAQRVLAAALSAGFRESGVQSLKALNDPQAFPMVAVRTAGLGLSSVVGFSEAGEDDGTVSSLVSEDYLKMMLRLASRRFAANTERIERFRDELQKQFGPTAAATGDGGDGKGGQWEDKQARAERKRREGLARQQAMKDEGKPEGTEGMMDLDLLATNDILDAHYAALPA